MEEEPQRQGGFDREVRIRRWRAPRARSLRVPGCDGRPGSPDGDVAPTDQGSLVGRPVSDAVFRLVFRLDFIPPVSSGSLSTSHLICATTPPFNKSRDFHATPDSLAAGASFQDRWSWERDVHQDWVDQITDDHPRLMETIESARHAHSDGMGAFICFMAVRLLEMRRVLKPTGSIYLHCDPTASHYLKAVMDAIFGRKNFRNEIAWCYRKWSVSASQFVRNHDVILMYAAGTNATFNPLFVPVSAGTMKRWKGNKQQAVFTGGVRQATSTSGSAETPCPDWWEISILNPNAKERTGYPTQKPLELYKRIIRASSNKGDIVSGPILWVCYHVGVL